MKANNVADLLHDLGWRSSSDAQHDNITLAVISGSLLDAIFADRKEIEIAEREAKP